MDLQLLIAQWSGATPPGFVRPAILETALPRCAHRRCPRKVALKRDGTPAKACSRCLKRRAASCRRRRRHFVEQGGCRRCAYRKRAEGDFLCGRCREDRDIERARKRRDAVDAAVIEEFAAKPDKAHRASNLDCGVSPWNARPKPEPTAAYWSPLPDPEPLESREWRWSPMNGRLHHRYRHPSRRGRGAAAPVVAPSAALPLPIPHTRCAAPCAPPCLPSLIPFFEKEPYPARSAAPLRTAHFPT